MDIRQKLLHNEIQHVGQIVQVLSYDLIVLQDFIKEQFGSAYDAFYKKHSEQTDQSEKKPTAQQLSSSKSVKITVTARKSTAPVQISKKRFRKRKGESDTSDSDALEEEDVREDCQKDPLEDEDVENDSKPSTSTNVNESDEEINEDETSMDVDLHTSDLPEGAERIEFSESTSSGRQRKAIWNKYVVSKLPNGKLFARCTNCNEPVSSKVERLETHYAKCVRDEIKSKSITNVSLFSKSLIDDKKAELEDQKMKVKKCIRESYKKTVKVNPASTVTTPNEFKPRGRQDDLVWTYFDVVLNSAGKRLPTCKRCNTRVSGKVERVRKHFIACHELDKCSDIDRETGENG